MVFTVKTERHHMVFVDIGTRNNKLTIQGLFLQLNIRILLNSALNFLLDTIFLRVF